MRPEGLKCFANMGPCAVHAMKALFGNIEAAPTPNDSKGRVVQAVGWKGENAHPHCVLCAP